MIRFASLLFLLLAGCLSLAAHARGAAARLVDADAQRQAHGQENREDQHHRNHAVFDFGFLG